MAHQQLVKRNFVKQQCGKLLTISVLAVVGTVAPTVAQKADHHAADGLSEDSPNTHNMMLVGKEVPFLSHLPMFDSLDETKTDYTSPHRYQVVLEVRFVVDGKDVTEIYVADRRKHPGTKMYTVHPTTDFVLPSLFTPEVKKPAATAFKATVFRGHLERGGRPVAGLTNVTVEVKRVVHAHEFDPSSLRPKALEYFLFGKGDDLFLAHSIVQPPDFDQIVSVKIPDKRFTEEELKQGVSVIFSDRKNTPSQRLKAKQPTRGRFQVTGLQQFHDSTAEVITEFYFEEGELAMPATFSRTPEERKAGF